jgi:hypothetical protein
MFQHKHENSSFLLCQYLARDLSENPLEEVPRVPHHDTYTGDLLLRSTVGVEFSTWPLVVVVPLGVSLRGRDTLPDAPGNLRLSAASEEASGTAAVPVPLVVGLSIPLGLLASA